MNQTAQEMTQKPPLSSESTPTFAIPFKKVIGHKMAGNGQILLKIEFYYLEIALWETFEAIANNSP